MKVFAQVLRALNSFLSHWLFVPAEYISFALEHLKNLDALGMFAEAPLR